MRTCERRWTDQPFVAIVRFQLEEVVGMRSRLWLGVLASICLAAPANAVEVASRQGPPGTAMERLENLRVAQR